MRLFLRLMLLGCVFMCCPFVVAQDKFQQELVPNGSGFSKSGTVTQPASTTKFGRPISVDDFVVIRGKYYDDDDGPIAIFVSLTDDKDRVVTKYLARVYEKTEKSSFQNGADLLLFGPQFYDGYEVMKVKFTIFRLGKTKAEKVFGEIKKYMTVVPTFVPGLSLTNPYTDFSMQLIGELIEKDKNKNKIAEFELPLKGLDTEPAIPQKWFAFAQGATAKKWNAQSSVSFAGDPTFDVPSLPAGTPPVDGSVLLVGALRRDPDTSYREILNRLKAIETSASEAIRSKIPVPSVGAGDAQAEQMTLDHLWFALFAKLKLAKDQARSRANIKEFFRDVDTLSQLATSGPPTGALVKLSEEKERVLSRQLVGVFGYQIGGQTAPDNLTKPALMFSTLDQWRNWFNQRCDLKKGNDPCASFDWKDDNHQQSPYVTATARYVLAKAGEDKKALDDKLAAKPADNKVLLPADFKGSLSNLLRFFQEQPDEPWMFFEQVAVARWIKQNFALKAGGEALPEVNLTADSEQVRAFAAKLRTAIAETKLLKASADGYAAYPLVKYAWDDLFVKKMKEIAAKNPLDVNQHEELKKAYTDSISKFWGQMSEAEKAEVKKSFSTLLKEPELRTDYATREIDGFFENTLLKVTGDAQPISSADPELLVTIGFYRSYRTEPEKFLTYVPAKEKQVFTDYIQSPLSVSALSRQFIGGAGKPLSVRQRGVKFLWDELVPSSLEHASLKLAPTNSTTASNWHLVFSSFVTGRTWDVSCNCFGGNEEEAIHLETLNRLGTRFSAFELVTSSDDLKDHLRTTLNFRFPPSAEPKTTKVKNEALTLLLKFTGLTLAERPEIKDNRSFWDQTYLADGVNLDLKSCQLGGTEKSIIVVRGQACPASAVTTPTPQPTP